MIGTAIYELLNVASVTNVATGGVYHTLAPQNVSYPYIVFNEQGRTENYKNGSSIRVHKVQVDIYASKGKDGAGGFATAESVQAQVEAVLNRFTGISGGKYIQQIYLESERAILDNFSQAARLILEFEVREDVTLALADPSNFPVTVNVFVNGVLDSSVVINAYENNNFNITA